jgi:hypothetical protein
MQIWMHKLYLGGMNFIGAPFYHLASSRRNRLRQLSFNTPVSAMPPIADAILDRIMQRNHRFTLPGD